jgi:hypothetical protein
LSTDKHIHRVCCFVIVIQFYLLCTKKKKKKKEKIRHQILPWTLDDNHDRNDEDDDNEIERGKKIGDTEKREK